MRALAVSLAVLLVAAAAAPRRAAARSLAAEPAAAADGGIPAELRIGMADQDTYPLVSIVDGAYRGFEPQLVQALAKQAGFKPQARAVAACGGGRGPWARARVRGRQAGARCPPHPAPFS